MVIDVAQTGIPRVDEATKPVHICDRSICTASDETHALTYSDSLYYERVEWVQPYVVQQVEREKMIKWKGPLTCGPIPDGGDAHDWVWKTITEDHPDTEAYCFMVYDEVKVYAEGEAQYERIQGSYWLKRSK